MTEWIRNQTIEDRDYRQDSDAAASSQSINDHISLRHDSPRYISLMELIKDGKHTADQYRD